MEIKIKRKEATISSDTIEIPAQGSANIPVVLENDSSYSNYIKEVHCGYYLNGVYCKVILPIENEKYLIPLEAFKFSGPLYLAVALVNVKEIIKTNQINFEVRAAPNGKVILPTENEWHILVKNYMDSLFENDYGDRFDEIGTNLEELAAEVQTQQEKITSQQTQIDNAIGNMGDYEIVQEDPVQIRFKKGDGTFGETVDLGDGLASKAMVNAGYYTYKGISYGGSASNNGIDVAEIDGAYSQETTNGFQLFDASKLPTKSQGGATVTNNDDGSFTISGSGSLTSDFSCYYNYSHEETLKMLKVGKITLNQNGDDTTPYAIFRLVKGNSGLWIQLIKTAQSANITQEMLQDSGCYIQVIIYGQSGSTIKAGTIKPMLYQDGDGTWEPFTGGIASPNPEYPQEPKFVGDYNEDAQKYDIDFMTSGKNLFDFNYLKNNYVIRGTKTYTDNSITLTSTGDDCYDNSFSSNTNFRIPVLPNKQYTLMLRKTNNVAGVVYIFPYTKNNVMHKQAISTNISYTGNIAYTFTTPQDCYYVSFRVGINLSGNTCTFSDFMVLYGTHTWDDVTEFIPYQGFETTTLQLNQPLRELPNGVKDTVENGIVTRRVGEITYDGSSDESWNFDTTYKYAAININGVTGYNIGVKNILCDKLYVINSNGSISDSTNVIRYGSSNNNNKVLYVHIDDTITSVSEFKTWLQSNPITVWYELATPTTEQITLPTLLSWYPYTNACVGTELQPSFVEWHIKTAGVNQNDLTVIKEDISQLQTETTHLNDDVTKLMGAFTSVTDLTKQLFLLMHRVGDIIFSTSDENPSTIYGGTWVAWGKGQVPVGVDTSDSDFNTVEKTGGEKEHTLTVGEMPSHTHAQYVTSDNVSGVGIRVDYTKDGSSLPYLQGINTGSSGGNQPHNNIQPYITCYMWKRVS